DPVGLLSQAGEVVQTDDGVLGLLDGRGVDDEAVGDALNDGPGPEGPVQRHGGFGDDPASVRLLRGADPDRRMAGANQGCQALFIGHGESADGCVRRNALKPRKYTEKEAGGGEIIRSGDAPVERIWFRPFPSPCTSMVRRRTRSAAVQQPMNHPSRNMSRSKTSMPPL